MSKDISPKPLSRNSAIALAAKVNALKIANENEVETSFSSNGSEKRERNVITQGKIANKEIKEAETNDNKSILLPMVNGKIPSQTEKYNSTSKTENYNSTSTTEKYNSTSKTENYNSTSKTENYNSTTNKNNKQDQDETITQEEKSLLQKVVRKNLIKNKYDVEIKQKDPSSPLYSVKSFESLHLKPKLLQGLYEMGFNAPSKIQETALPTLLANPPQNMIAQSQSGTGKTAAFVLTMLSRVNPSLRHTQALCICPTLELAIQLGEVVCKMGLYCPEIETKYCVRGEEAPHSIESHIIIGTPGKVLDWSLRLRLIDLKNIKVFVLDEADIMINMQGHQDQTIRVMKGLSSSCQIMLFSATYDAPLMKFAEMMIPHAIIIKLRREEESLDNIKQFYVRCHNMEEKYNAIVNLYSTLTIGQSMIFCQTKKIAELLSQKMTKDGHAVAILTGDLTVEQRISILDRFRENQNKALITTNVLARGIDIETVSLVINFDVPLNRDGLPDCETYLHRIGRTGRFGKEGVAVNIIETEKDLQKLKVIENHFGINIKLLNVEDLDEIEREANSAR